MGDLGLASGWPEETLRGGVPSPCRARGDVAPAYPAVHAEELHTVGLLPEYPLTGRGQPDTAADPWGQALESARRLASSGLAALVLDSDAGFVRLGRSAELAEALG